MSRLNSVRVLALMGSLSLALAFPAQAQGVGAIGGTATDESGAVLPGVTVTLSSPGLIGGSQTTTTDEQGTYQFTRLVPGRYSVKGELQGFRTVVQEDITVNADRTSRADLRLGIGNLQETVTVSGMVPLLDTTSALNQTVMQREVLDALPTATDIFSIARLAPAVSLSRYDVGGREMIGQSRAMVHGSTRDEYSYMVDGMDINSYAGGISFQVDSASFQELNYQTSNGPAEQSRSGVQINMVTKTGSNAVHGAGMFQRVVHESSNVSGGLREQLLSAVPATVRAVNPDIEPGGQIEHMFDSAFNVSGPIMRDRLWYLSSVRLGEVYSYRVGSYNPDGTQLLIDHQLINTMGKVSWAMSPGSQLHFTHAWVRKGRFHVAETGTATEFYDKAATHYNDSRNHLFFGKWTRVLSSNLVVDAAAITTYGNNNQQLQRDPQVKPGDIARYDSVTRVNSVAKGQYNINEGYRTNAATSVSITAGRHDVKFGYQFVRNENRAGGISTSHYPAGLRAVFRSGVPDSVNTYNSPTEYTRKLNEHAVYLQDRWRPLRKLTLNLGVRFETYYGWIDDGKSPLCQQATIFIEGRCFPPVTGAPDWKNVVPRFSAIYDLFGSGRTALKFSANQYRIHQDNLTLTTNPIRLTNDTRPWQDLNNDLIPQLNELGPSTGFNLGTTNRFADDLTWPSVREIAAEIEQELAGQVVVTAGYYYRAHRDAIGSRNMAVPTSSYTPITVTEVASGRTVTVWNQDPATRGRFDVAWGNYSELNRNFHGFDLSASKRLSHRWMLMGSLSLGKTDADIQGTADLNNPNFAVFRRGLGADDLPVFFKLAGTYEAPYGVAVGFNGSYTAGLPETTTVLVNANTVRLTQVTQRLVVDPRGTVRLPSVKMVDLNFRRRLKVGNLTLDPRLDIFNVFNSSAVTLRVEQLGPAYHRATELLGGRLIKLGFNLTF